MYGPRHPRTMFPKAPMTGNTKTDRPPTGYVVVRLYDKQAVAEWGRHNCLRWDEYAAIVECESQRGDMPAITDPSDAEEDDYHYEESHPYFRAVPLPQVMMVSYGASVTASTYLAQQNDVCTSPLAKSIDDHKDIRGALLEEPILVDTPEGGDSNVACAEQHVMAVSAGEADCQKLKNVELIVKIQVAEIIKDLSEEDKEKEKQITLAGMLESVLEEDEIDAVLNAFEFATSESEDVLPAGSDSESSDESDIERDAED
eukprot:gene9397-11133_t